MRYALILVGGMVAAMVGCQSTDSQYGLHGEVNQSTSSQTNMDQRSFDSNTTIDKSHDNIHEK